MRKVLNNLADRTKKLKQLDLLFRYYPRHRVRAMQAICQFKDAKVEQRRVLAVKFQAETIRKASRTRYGRQFGSKIGDYPILGKSLVRDKPTAFQTKNWLVIPASTGGSTGLPLKLRRDIRNIAAEQVFLDNTLSSANLTFRTARIAVLRANEVKDPSDNRPPFATFNSGRDQLILSNAHLSKNTVNWFVSAVTAFNPDFFWVYPSMLDNFIQLMNENDQQLSVPVVLSSSENISSEERRAFAQHLGCQTIDYYGQAERVCFASSTTPGEYWFEPAYGHVELIRQGQANDRNQIEAKIIATGYWNNAMPLVRFDTGDLALLPADATDADIELIALGLKSFSGIAGRTNEYVTGPDGKKIGGLNHIPREVNHVLRVQVIQQSETKVDIHITTTPEFNARDRDQLLANARRLIPRETEISIMEVAHLETLPNGKTPLVIRRLAT